MRQCLLGIGEIILRHCRQRAIQHDVLHLEQTLLRHGIGWIQLLHLPIQIQSTATGRPIRLALLQQRGRLR